MNYIKSFFAAEFDEKKRRHNFAFFIVVFLCILICLSALPSVGESVKYPLDTPQGKTWWVQQFDAFEKGQLHLDLPEVPELEALENPYDRAQREGIKYPWDRAYYEGKFYSYFGIAPILTVYYPFYILTGELPSVSAACLITAIIAMLFLGLAYREFVIRFCRGASLWLVLLLFFGVAFASGIFIGICWSDSYYLAVLSAIEWSMIFIFLGFRAMRAERTWVRASILSLAAISLTLTVWSRPTAAVICLVVLPIFVEYAVRAGRAELKNKIISIASFTVPLAPGVGAVMWYNAARFGSPFDFGSSYQLTVSDISKNTIEISMLGDAMYYYFIRPAGFDVSFPFFKLEFLRPVYEGRYFYAAKAVGAFAFGLPALSVASPFVGKIKKDPARLATAILALVLCAGVAFFDYCYAGLDMRYIIDVLPILAIIGAMALLCFHARSGECGHEVLRVALSVFSVALCVLAVMMTLAATLANGNSHIFFIK